MHLYLLGVQRIGINDNTLATAVAILQSFISDPESHLPPTSMKL